ncbi:TauD/TfdA dioxygenase family protein [Cyanobacterium sp. Dongsha4]|uniref:TauD/TfdA dioxygenase family protein n=1 Tax=Cyanobacterium sp. DS4 TaxID=2878255 RepID=UPI002E809FE8|nr:TauD/TfdA family dioxygenase [Cyanobacterium sp. Dongsha4]WVK98905.1 TauD/TfdA family dioxygenase [Cyanobacterium sp. Dongsha4]
MKTKPLSNYGASVGVEAYDIDWDCQEEIIELGKLCASQCIVFVNQNIPVKKINEVMIAWGDPSMALIHEAIISKKVHGRHWREIFLNVGYPNKEIDENMPKYASIISYKKSKKNRPLGFFQNGELNWHSDQCAFDDGQRIIGLQSLSGTENSQTQFLCTHDAYESLSSQMQSMVKELIVKHKWVDNFMAPGLNSLQNVTLRYNMIPMDGMETRLYSETASGLPGMKIPSHSFDGFVGMSRAESDRIMDEIKKVTYKEKYIYTQNWQDGQIVFMDQEITLHKRPTNIQDGDQRTMARSIFYVNKIFNSQKSQRLTHIRYKGDFYSVDDFIDLVDKDRKRIFEEWNNKGKLGISESSHEFKHLKK